MLHGLKHLFNYDPMRENAIAALGESIHQSDTYNLSNILKGVDTFTACLNKNANDLALLRHAIHYPDYVWDKYGPRSAAEAANIMHYKVDAHCHDTLARLRSKLWDATLVDISCEKDENIQDILTGIFLQRCKHAMLSDRLSIIQFQNECLGKCEEGIETLPAKAILKIVQFISGTDLSRPQRDRTANIAANLLPRLNTREDATNALLVAAWSSSDEIGPIARANLLSLNYHN